MADRFLRGLDLDAAAAHEYADYLRDQGDDAAADQVEHEEAERTIAALEAHGYRI